MRKPNTGTVPYVKIGLISAAVVFLMVGGFLLLKRWEENTGRFPEHEIGDPVIRYEGDEYVLKDNVETFLDIQQENGYISRAAVVRRETQHFKPFLAQTALLGSKQTGNYKWLKEKYYNKNGF